MDIRLYIHHPFGVFISYIDYPTPLPNVYFLFLLTYEPLDCLHLLYILCAVIKCINNTKQRLWPTPILPYSIPYHRAWQSLGPQPTLIYYHILEQSLNPQGGYNNNLHNTQYQQSVPTKDLNTCPYRAIWPIGPVHWCSKQVNSILPLHQDITCDNLISCG